MTIEQRGNHTAVNIVRYAPTVTFVWRKTGFGTIVQQITLQVMTRRICYPTAVTVGEVKWVMILDCFNGRYLTMPIPSGLVCTNQNSIKSVSTVYELPRARILGNPAARPLVVLSESTRRSSPRPSAMGCVVASATRGGPPLRPRPRLRKRPRRGVARTSRRSERPPACAGPPQDYSASPRSPCGSSTGRS